MRKLLVWTIRILVLFFVLFLALYLAGYRFLLPDYHSIYFTQKKYRASLSALDLKRKNLAQRKASTQEAAKVLENALTEKLFPFWYGTMWGYNGTSQTPGRGRIACGYFVTTILKDAGFKVNYQRLAQKPSEEMITQLIDEKNITRMNRITMRKFVQTMVKKGDGLYIVGLDTHTGFLSVNGEQVHFIHSSGRFPFCVLKEEAINSRTLRESKYKVCGKLTADSRLLKRWLRGVRV